MNNQEESFEKDKQLIIDLVKENLQITFAGEIETFQKLWHPKAHRFGLGNSNELYSFSRAELCEHMQQLTAAKKDNPSLAQIEIIFDEIDFINIHQNLIASVAVKWHMNMPDSIKSSMPLIVDLNTKKSKHVNRRDLFVLYVSKSLHNIFLIHFFVTISSN
ncbi:MAG: nuclear transport factor 2 family protein [Candidatus Heimdallarchaeota archaeon]